MKGHLRFVLALFVIGLAMLGIFLLGTPNAQAQGPSPRAPLANTGTAFTYQGQLKNNGTLVNGSCDIAFHLYDSASSGTQIGAAITPTVAITNGLFTVPLDFGTKAITGAARWLDVQVRCPSGSGTFTAMNTRQSLTPVPMALALPGLYTQQNGPSPNIIGGYSGNYISPTVVGGTIGGGGDNNGFPNQVLASYATVSGGWGNIASGKGAFVGGGGWIYQGAGGNTAQGHGSTIGGGRGNLASGEASTIGGGDVNLASGIGAFVGGGGWNGFFERSNKAQGGGSTIGGGVGNIASGLNSTVPGGALNTAAGEASFAAGTNAKALHTGTFVWADWTPADFASTGNNQFLIRANGGVGINTNAPARSLDVNGVIGIFDGGTRTYNGGLASEVGGQLVEMGINDDATNRFGGNYDSAAQGGLFRVDARGGQNVFQFYGRPAGSTSGLVSLASLNAAGVLAINGLGSSGVNLLCRNASNEIASCSSSIRYKNNVANLNLGLDAIAKLRPVTFNWKDSGQADLGFIAEQVNQVTPLLTTLNQSGQIEGVQYDRISAILVKGMQEQQQQIADLRMENAVLKQQNVSFEARLMVLEQNTLAKSNGVNVTFDLNGFVLGALLIGAVIVYRTRK